LTANVSADLELMRASLLLEADPPAAARRASEILAAFPDHAEASLLLAAACRNLGEPATAATVLESVAAAHATSPVIQLELGRAYAAAGRAAEALKVIRRSVELDPDFADGWRELAAQCFVMGETLAGDVAYARYALLWQGPPELADAAQALADGRVEAAEKILRRHLIQLPHDVAALRLLAEVALRREDDPQAERLLAQCLALAPGFAAARFDLARLHYAQHKLTQALAHLDRLLGAQPSGTEYLILKSQVLRQLSRTQEALVLLETAVTEQPKDERAWVEYGVVLRELGQGERALEAFRQALVTRPGCPGAYMSLANLKTYRFTATEVEAMRQQLALEGVRSDRIQLEFALGAALEQRGEFAESFEHYAHGNSLQRATLFYDPQFKTAQVKRARTLFNAPFFAARNEWGSERDDPIFVVGLPRSGSTLLEQMLASHSQIEGTRELADLPALAFELVSRVATPNEATQFEQIEALRAEDAASLAARYLEGTRAHRPLGKARFIDKLGGNWSQLGLIQLLFPRAAIIDARRHPLASGFSCYKQLFGRGQKFTYDLRELGLFTRDYITLMQHFDETLPGRVHRVHYEHLVANPEGELRRLFAYLGLPYEEQCMRFHENPRSVSTLSSEQVRQPLYAESLDHWRNYEAWLGPLQEALGALVERYPQAPVS
jgi:predicted Zn-dependent protease